MKAPFPYFGGKSTVASYVWGALGDPAHYIEPFCGSAAVLLARPNYIGQTESINDADGYIANVWRALQADPDAVAKVCDWPVNHADLIARKKRLIAEGASLLERLCADDAYFDVKFAGYWIWASSCWIGSGLTRLGSSRPHISDAGKGVHAKGQIPHIGHAGKGNPDVRDPYKTNLWEWFRQLSERLRKVRVVCGDWTRVCGGNWQDKLGVCGIFMDPPYGTAASRDAKIYHVDSQTVSADVHAWCHERGTNPNYRIVIAGYSEEHESLLADGWTCRKWSAGGGYGNMGGAGDGTNGKVNRHREALFFSPHCLKAGDLFGTEKLPAARMALCR